MSDKPRVVVAMSGGVDSSVAAALLVVEGVDDNAFDIQAVRRLPADYLRPHPWSRFTHNMQETAEHLPKRHLRDCHHRRLAALRASPRIHNWGNPFRWLNEATKQRLLRIIKPDGVVTIFWYTFLNGHDSFCDRLNSVL